MVNREIFLADSNDTSSDSELLVELIPLVWCMGVVTLLGLGAIFEVEVHITVRN